MHDFAIKRRLAQLTDPTSGRSVILALSHGLLAGPLPGIEGAGKRRDLVEDATDAGVSGLILSAGEIRESSDLMSVSTAPGLAVTAGWTSLWRSDQAPGITHDYARGAYRNILDPSSVLAHGGDVAHVYLLIGDQDPEREADEFERIARFIEEAHRIGLPVLVEGLVRGVGVVGQEKAPGYVATVARMAAESGADMLKIEFPGSAAALERIVADVAVPVIVLGGGKKPFAEILEEARGVVDAGAQGVVYGRNIFQSDKPRESLERLVEIVLG